ncbi:MAG: haloacid dehalogenase-like hydrolase [Deltaproteobacteria bacterium]|nr:haloacid dehalogenase-like hydrolase [Deltaproteobacteria bacterium]
MGRPPKVMLFDLDGTLVRTGGAGMRAMGHVFRERFGVENVFQSVVPDGKTDPMIFLEILEKYDLAFDDEATLLAELETAYEDRLRAEMPVSPGACVIRGIPELLDALAGLPGVVMGLLTGNYAATARIKLDRFDLNRYFPFGAFATDSAIRRELVPVAVRRAEEHAGRPIGVGRHVYVIGDTPRDVECALDNGATAVGVATANNDVGDAPPRGRAFRVRRFFRHAGGSGGFRGRRWTIRPPSKFCAFFMTKAKSTRRRFGTPRAG